MGNKNECGKTRPEENPYEIWVNGSWEWRVLKKYQSPDKENTNPFARWFCAVKSPYTYGGYELGDVYVSEIVSDATRIDADGTAQVRARAGMPSDPLASILG